VGLEGRLAWVTGGGRGIGRACALALAREGCKVAVSARTAGEINAVADECSNLSRHAFAAVCDVTDASEVALAYRMITETMDRPPDILVSNAGWAQSAPFLKATLQSLDDHMQVNLHGTFHAAQAALPAMLERKWGRIVVVASVAGKIGTPYTAAYTASKHAVVGLARSMAAEFADRGVTVNAVCPGYVDTALTDKNIQLAAARTGKSEHEMREKFKSFSPQGRLTTPEEVAHVVAFLCQEAAGNINGQAITVDGGAVQW
jgi:NAD(P)-dependent dehydrogenase (short-subunit alcohol dehydrogenase family)